jgi:hypothetical protein
MPIDYRIDRRRMLVLVTPRGLLTHGEMVAYQGEVWTRPELSGFDELIDMSNVDRLDLRSPDQIFELAALSAGMDSGKPRSKMAIVASDRLHAALGALYRASRAESPSNRRDIEVFPDLEAALDWLRPQKRPSRQGEGRGPAGRKVTGRRTRPGGPRP